MSTCLSELVISDSSKRSGVSWTTAPILPLGPVHTGCGVLANVACKKLEHTGAS